MSQKCKWKQNAREAALPETSNSKYRPERRVQFTFTATGCFVIPMVGERTAKHRAWRNPKGNQCIHGLEKTTPSRPLATFRWKQVLKGHFTRQEITLKRLNRPSLQYYITFEIKTAVISQFACKMLKAVEGKQGYLAHTRQSHRVKNYEQTLFSKRESEIDQRYVPYNTKAFPTSGYYALAYQQGFCSMVKIFKTISPHPMIWITQFKRSRSATGH